MKATTQSGASGKTVKTGSLVRLEDCWISVPASSASSASSGINKCIENGKIYMYSLPDISDSKSATYNDEPIIGRAFPLKTYSHSDNRSINWQMHMFVMQKEDIQCNLSILRLLESCVYPRSDSKGAPFIPPVICQIKCGKLLGDEPLCVVLKNYSTKFDTNLPWDEDTYMPYKLDVDLQWDVVYKTSDLPGQDRIIRFGR